MNLSIFNRSGIFDWMLQRASSVIMLAYTLTIMSVLVPNVSFDTWSMFMTQTWMRGFSTLVLLAMIVHAWIGFWAVMTDYVTTRLLGPLGDTLRLCLLFLMAVLLLVYLLWGIFIIWGLVSV